MAISSNPRDLDRPSTGSHEKRTVRLRGFLGAGYFRAAEAMDYAAGFHSGLRKDGVTPEFAHQVYIVSYLSTLLPHLRHPEETLTVGFLHDVVATYVKQFLNIYHAEVEEDLPPRTLEVLCRRKRLD